MSDPINYESMARDHVRDLVSGRLPREDVQENISEDLRRAHLRGRDEERERIIKLLSPPEKEKR